MSHGSWEVTEHLHLFDISLKYEIGQNFFRQRLYKDAEGEIDEKCEEFLHYELFSCCSFLKPAEKVLTFSSHF